MKSSKMTEAVLLQKNCTDQNLNIKNKTHVNEELKINNERINNINVGADASVRPEHKGNTQKGITLLALIITIIVLLILSVVSVCVCVCVYSRSHFRAFHIYFFPSFFGFIFFLNYFIFNSYFLQ